MIEHPDYTTPLDEKADSALMLAHFYRDVDPETWGQVGICELRETCVVWLAMRQRVRAEGRAL